MMAPENKEKLRICLISYRSNPHCGGQGVYLKRICRALKDLGHHVEVVSGPPDPQLGDDILVHQLPCLDLYNPEAFCRLPTMKEFMDPINLIEWLGVCTMGFPEPFTFGLRARRYLRDKYHRFDVIHDNQSLSYGVAAMNKFVPTTATIHHPITQDRKIDLRAEGNPFKKLKWHRWYSFLGMQKKVARGFSHVITVSNSAAEDIQKDFGVDRDRFRVVPLGISTDLFYPIPGIEKEKDRLIVTNSADTPLKGLAYLLHAVHNMARRKKVNLTVIGQPKKNGVIERLVRDLELGRLVTFTGRVSDKEFVEQYARSNIAVVPSVYEGFGLPAGEAMACALPVVSTTGGALPEVVGDAGLLVPPKNPVALESAISDLLDNPNKAQKLGEAGYRRVHEQFTWKRAGERTVDAYRETIRDHRRLRSS